MTYCLWEATGTLTCKDKETTVEHFRTKESASACKPGNMHLKLPYNKKTNCADACSDFARKHSCKDEIAGYRRHGIKEDGTKVCHCVKKVNTRQHDINERNNE